MTLAEQGFDAEGSDTTGAAGASGDESESTQTPDAERDAEESPSDASPGVETPVSGSAGERDEDSASTAATEDAEPEESRTEQIPVLGTVETAGSEDPADPPVVASAATGTGPASEPEEGSGTRTDTDTEADEARTEAMPAPAAGAVAFAAPPPEKDANAGDGSGSTSAESAFSASPPAEGAAPGDPADDAALWPTPRRLSDYVSDQPASEGSSATPGGAESGAAAGAGAVGAAAATGAGAAGAGAGGAGTPGGPGGPTDSAEGPGDGSGKNKKKKAKKPLWLRILLGFLAVTGLGFILACGVFTFFYVTVEVPDAAKADAVEQGSTFYFADGETEFAYRGTDRDVISYEEMTAGGDHVVEAVISAEDRGFWTEPGVSISGTMRAVWSTITGEQVQGGSTVTQQMVRNYYEGVSLEQTVSRKVQEIIISIKVDRSEDKEWVMEQYLNTIYFGRTSYGVQAASQAYYHKDVDELTAEEAAFLAAAIQQPTRFGQADVETTPDMENRWQYVVNGMVTTGAITQAEADAMEFPAPEPEKTTEDLSGYRGYMLQEAMSELSDLGYSEDHINRQGFKIVTTFDKDMMDAAYESVEEMVAPDSLPEGVNIGLTTIDPKTGEVLAFYGGHDYHLNQYDSSFLGAAQAGSAFKPYVLATALEQGYGLNSTVDGRGPRDIHGSRVQNANNASGGVMTLTQATTVSNNLGFVELAQEVGFEEVRQTAYDVGLPDGSIDDNQLVPVMPLGATSVRSVDQASGYATFANGGVHMEAHVIKEIVNQEGDNERPEIEGKKALEASTASDVTYALEQAVSSGTGTAAQLWDHPVAGKTGTTNGSVAAWFVGYTPQLSTAVGVYSGNNESFQIPGHNISGGGLPAQMWKSYMNRAMEGYERASFPGPEFGGTTENWAPDPATQEPQQPEAPEGGEPEVPEVPETPEVPTDPEPEVPEVPTFPENPEGPGEPEEPGNPEIPPGRGEETG